VSVGGAPTRRYTGAEMRPAPAPPDGPGERAVPESLDARKLRALAEIGGTVVSGDGFEQVLAEVIEKVARLLHARGGGIMLYDPEAGTLATQEPAFGLSPELVREYRVSLSDGGNAASVFVTGQGYFTNDARHDPRVIRRFAVRHAITRLLTVPLRLEGQSIGVFHAIDKVGADFNEEDLELMTSIAPQLAVLVNSAMVMRQSRQHQRDLERMLEVQDEFTEMLLRGEEIASLLSRLSQLLEQPVLLLDPSGSVLAASDDWEELGLAGSQLQSLAAEWAEQDRVRNVSLDGGISLTAVRVQVHADTLGFLIAADGDESGNSTRILEQASVLFALDIVRTRELDVMRNRLEGDIVTHLLAATKPDEAASLLRRLGVPDGSAYRCAVVEFGGGSSEPHPVLSPGFKARVSRLQRELRLRLENEALPSLVVERGDGLWLLLSIEEGGAEQAEAALRRVVTALSRGAGDEDWAFIVGVGSTVAELVELAESSEQARIAVAIGRRLGSPNRVLLYDELGPYRLLARPADGAEVRQYVDSVLGPLLEYDRENEADWTSFLVILVKTNFRVTSAAALAGCHINTAKYRLSRIEALLERDFQSASDRFAIQLALEIRSVADIVEG